MKKCTKKEAASVDAVAVKAAAAVVAPAKKEVVAKKSVTKKSVTKKVDAPKKAVKKANPRAGQPRGHRVVFSYVGEPGKQVFVAGDFNEWNPLDRALADVNNNGEYMVRFLLKAGSYQYKLVVDGQWIQDPKNEKIVPNEFGGFNNVLEVSDDAE